MRAVEVEDLVKSYPAHRRARELIRYPFRQRQELVLDGLCLSLDAGESLAILGANGAGKTTLLKVIAGLILPTHGRVLVNGFDVRTSAGQAQAGVSYCFSEERSFYWRLTGRENLEFFAALVDLHGSQARKTMSRLGEKLGIGSYLDRPFSHYSAGVRQRFALARALIGSPRILLLDEPTRSIDPVEARNIWSMVREDLIEDQGVTVILVTHQTQEAIAVCDRVAFIEDGTIAAEMPASELKRTVSGQEAFTLTLQGLSARELPRLQCLEGIRELAYREHNDEQHLDVWCDDGDLALSALIAAATSSGAHVRALTRGADPAQVMERMIKVANAR
jgi:ABC-2 type transport system ATP-binding protein